MEARVNPINNSFSKFTIEATGYDPNRHQFRNKELIHLHDPLAVGVVIHPDLVKKQKLSLNVEIQEGEYLGKIVEGLGDSNIDVCLAVDAERFLELFLSSLR
jgi:inosine-uridine nucleoside N-ribohydrolase